MANPLASFSGVEASTDQQKAALGKMIAAQGSTGVEQYKNQQAVAKAAIAPARASVINSNPGIGAPAMSSAVGPGDLTRTLAARAAAPATLGFQQAGQAASDFAGYTGLLGEANSNYMGAVSAAAPIVQSQTAAQVAQIQADAAGKTKAAQQAADDAATQRDWEAYQRKIAVEDRAYELGQRKKKEAAQAKAADLADNFAYSPEKAGESLGWSDKKIKEVSNSDAYQRAQLGVTTLLKTIGPGADPSTVRGIIEQVMRTPIAKTKNAQGQVVNVYPEEVSGMRTLLMRQFLGAFGKALPAAPLKGSTAAGGPPSGHFDTQTAGDIHETNQFNSQTLPSTRPQGTPGPDINPSGDQRGDYGRSTPKGYKGWDINRLYAYLQTVPVGSKGYTDVLNELTSR